MAYGAKLWSAAARCRFPPSQLAGWSEDSILPASSLAGLKIQILPASSLGVVLETGIPASKLAGRKSGSKLPHSKASLREHARVVEGTGDRKSSTENRA
jgi:hypothetical protein